VTPIGPAGLVPIVPLSKREGCDSDIVAMPQVTLTLEGVSGTDGSTSIEYVPMELVPVDRAPWEPTLVELVDVWSEATPAQRLRTAGRGWAIVDVPVALIINRPSAVRSTEYGVCSVLQPSNSGVVPDAGVRVAGCGWATRR